MDEHATVLDTSQLYSSVYWGSSCKSCWMFDRNAMWHSQRIVKHLGSEGERDSVNDKVDLLLFYKHWSHPSSLDSSFPGGCHSPYNNGLIRKYQLHTHIQRLIKNHWYILENFEGSYCCFWFDLRHYTSRMMSKKRDERYQNNLQ